MGAIVKNIYFSLLYALFHCLQVYFGQATLHPQYNAAGSSGKKQQQRRHSVFITSPRSIDLFETRTPKHTDVQMKAQAPTTVPPLTSGRVTFNYQKVPYLHDES